MLFNCTKCKTPFEKQRKVGGSTYCSSCRKEYQNARYKRMKEDADYQRSRLDTRYKNRYDISVDTYEKMFKDQEGKCGICSQEMIAIDSRTRLDVDHCHVYGWIRGLLCRNCNHGLGKFKDSIELLEAAINYLKEWES